jgi:hypothetical protein
MPRVQTGSMAETMDSKRKRGMDRWRGCILIVVRGGLMGVRFSGFVSHKYM